MRFSTTDSADVAHTSMVESVAPACPKPSGRHPLLIVLSKSQIVPEACRAAGGLPCRRLTSASLAALASGWIRDGESAMGESAMGSLRLGLLRCRLAWGWGVG
jgi:hypothetical protein